MRNIKNIALSALLTVGSFSLVTYTACREDNCKDVHCENGSTCFEGDCVCLLGYIGDRCQFEARYTYDSTYRGNGFDDKGNNFVGWHLTYKPLGDAPTDMSLSLLDANKNEIRSFTLKLTTTNNTFVLNPKTVDTFDFTGFGTIHVDSTSFHLKVVERHTTEIPPITTNITYKEFRRL